MGLKFAENDGISGPDAVSLTFINNKKMKKKRQLTEKNMIFKLNAHMN